VEGDERWIEVGATRGAADASRFGDGEVRREASMSIRVENLAQRGVVARVQRLSSTICHGDLLGAPARDWDSRRLCSSRPIPAGATLNPFVRRRSV
jgi:hypothetical protein